MKCENLQKEESITQERLNWEAERTDLREQIDQWKLETNLVQIKIENLQKAIMEAYDALCNVNTYLVS